MVSFPTTVNPPANYAPPNMAAWLASFLQQGIGDLPQDADEAKQRQQQQQLNAQKIQQQQNELDLQKKLAVPINTTDPTQIEKLLLQAGGGNYAAQLLPYLVQQQPVTPSPLLSGNGANSPGAAPTPGRTPVANVSGDSGSGTLTDLITAKYGNTATTGQLLGKIVGVMNVDPNAQLTPGQTVRAQGLIKRYAPPTTAPQPSAQPISADGVQPPETANSRVADAFSALPPSVGAITPAATPRANAGGGGLFGNSNKVQPGAAAPAAPISTSPQGSQQPVVVGTKQFPDVQTALAAVRAEETRLAMSPNPRERAQLPVLQQVASDLEWRSRTQGFGMAGEGAETLDADAERYRQTGTLPPNMGRGIQGQQLAAAIRTRAAELEISQGGNPSNWPERWAQYQGEKSYQRTGGTYGMRVEAASNEVEQALPLALDASRNLPRGEWVPWNKLVQAWEQGTSDPAYNDFVVKNFSLINAYTRAMNPSGQPRITERLEQKADNILSKATSPKAYEVQLRALWQEVQRSKGAIANARKGLAPTEQDFPGDTKNTAADQNGGGWVTLPNGNRIRQVQ